MFRCAAGVGVVYNKKAHAQTFFLKHDNDIVSMNIVDAEVEVAQFPVSEEDAGNRSGASVRMGTPAPGVEPEWVKYPGRTLVATGQMKQGETEESGARYPFVCIWDTRTGEEVRRINLERDDRQALAIGFNATGDKVRRCSIDELVNYLFEALSDW